MQDTPLASSSHSFAERLTVPALARIARREVATQVPPELLERVARDAAEATAIATRQPVYGRSTGVGANRSTQATASPAEHGLHLLRSHATDGGDALPRELVRATLAVRLNQILQGGSGMAPEVAQALAGLLERDALPELRDLGGIGTGDLPALAGIALALIGERPTMPALAPLLPGIGADSALPFISSSALTIARAALLIERLSGLLSAQRRIFCLSVLAARANREAFAPRVARALGSEAAPGVAAELAATLADTTWQPLRIQDPYAFRAFLPAHALLVTALERLRQHVEALMNVAQENPLFASDEHRAYHHGAFYQVALAHELDASALALAQNAPLLIARLRFLDDEAISGLPRFLAPAQGGSSGTMMVEYLAADALSEVLAASAPVSMHTTVLSCGVEDDATFAPAAVRKLERAAQHYQRMLACELLVALRALRLRDDLPRPFGAGIQDLLEQVQALPAAMQDRSLRADVEQAQALVPILGQP